MRQSIIIKEFSNAESKTIPDISNRNYEYEVVVQGKICRQCNR